MLTKLQRDLISTAVESTVDELVVEHYPAKTQEHQLTARIGQKLEDRLNNMEILEHRFSVTTQDFPDKGPSSLEKPTGTDLYIGISLVGRNGFDKGLLIQSKWNDNKNKREFSRQCERMLAISDASYAWIYGPRGVRVINAESVVRNPDTAIKARSGRDLGTMFSEVLRCKEGDLQLGVPALPRPQRRVAVTALMEQIGAKVGIDVAILPIRLAQTLG